MTRKTHITARIRDDVLRALDRLPGDSRAARIEHAVMSVSVIEAVLERIEKMETGIGARLLMLEKRIENQQRGLSEHEARRIFAIFATAFAAIMKEKDAAQMREIRDKIRAGGYAPAKEDQQR